MMLHEHEFPCISTGLMVMAVFWSTSVPFWSVSATNKQTYTCSQTSVVLGFWNVGAGEKKDKFDFLWLTVKNVKNGCLEKLVL